MAKTDERGRIGQLRYGSGSKNSVFFEEFLPELRGNRAVQAYTEMADNDATIGSVLFAIEMLMRQCEFHIEPAGDTEQDEKAAEFVESCMDDMENTWADTLSEILSFLTYGWSAHEIVYKRRVGKTSNPITNSKYEDGLIGWRKLPIRSQDTLYGWDYEEGTDNLIGMTQCPPPDYGQITIPMEKLLHFRTRSRKNNPEGRALALDTAIPTPDGWTTIGKLNVGSRIFDEAGKVRHVTATKEWADRPCYRLKFSDGSEIIADENHLWLTCNLYERTHGKPGKLRTTKEIFETLKTKQGASNHCIQVSAPLEYVKQGLILDPYYLGQWLGDGNSRNTTITTHADDAEETLRLIGYDGTIEINGKVGGLGRQIKIKNKGTIGSPIEKLRAMGLILNKHIPEQYLRGNYEQRLSLLQGLMDSDGTVDAMGRCTFTNSNKQLADGVYELVTSLGCTAYMSQKLPDGNKRKQVSHQVKFTPITFIPFRLKRKCDRVKTEKARNYHYIVECTAVENRKTKCIEVDSPSHLFLAGKAMIPTHNSILRTAYRAHYFKKRLEEIEAYGIERDLAGFPVLYGPPDFPIWDSEDPEMVNTLAMAQRIVSSIRRDALEGLVLPGGDNGWKLELLTSGGRRQFDTNAVLDRYDRRIATSVLADFVMLGQQAVGSFALADNKTKIFALAIGTYLDVICEVFNNQGIPRLIDINGEHFKGITDYPRMVHGDIETPDLQQFSKFLTDMIGSGVLVPDEAIEEEVRRIGGLPEKIETGIPQEMQQGEVDGQGVNEIESKSIYKVTSLLEKYRKDQITRETAASLFESMGLDDQKIEFYLTEAEKGKKQDKKEKAEEEAAEAEEELKPAQKSLFGWMR